MLAIGAFKQQMYRNSSRTLQRSFCAWHLSTTKIIRAPMFNASRKQSSYCLCKMSRKCCGSKKPLLSSVELLSGASVIVPFCRWSKLTILCDWTYRNFSRLVEKWTIRYLFHIQCVTNELTDLIVVMLCLHSCSTLLFEDIGILYIQYPSVYNTK